MDQTAKSSFIIGRAAMLNAEIAMRQAANEERLSLGKSIAYGEEEFSNLMAHYNDLEYNNILSYLRE